MKKEFWSDMAGLGIMFLVMLGAAVLRAYIWLYPCYCRLTECGFNINLSFYILCFP